jgi:hypothetical protein
MSMPPFKKQKREDNVCPCSQVHMDHSHNEFTNGNGKKSHIGCNRDVNKDIAKPKRLTWQIAEKATVLHINVQTIQDQATPKLNTMMQAKDALDLYSCVYKAAVSHCIWIIEPRADSFVCVLDAEDPDCAGDPVGKLLTFAADLHSNLANRSLQAHMGMASGETTLVGTLPAVIGDAATIAEDMARLGAVAAVSVDESALIAWAAAARRAAPAAQAVECSGGRRRRGATFELETGCFRAEAVAAAPKITAATPQPPSLPSPPRAALRRSASL